MKLRILKLGLYLLAAPWATALIVVILLLRPLIEVRLFVIPLRMSVITAAAWIRVLREKSRKPLVVLAYDEDPRVVNQSLAHHLGTYAGWRRGPRALLLTARWIVGRVGLCRHLVLRAPSAPFDDIFWHRTYDYRPSLSRVEQESAEQGLEALGITESTKVIAILTRDHGFFKSFTDSETWMRRHNYRNCRIENYSDAIEYAHRQGFRSVRVGRVSDNHLEVAPDGYVDYSASPVQSDLMDLVLATRCEFIVTCSSGLDGLYWLCGKAFVGVNLPWLDGKFANYSLALPKRMFVEIDGALTELPVIAVTSTAFVPQHFSKEHYVPHWNGKPVALRENSAAEILETMQLALAMQADPRLAEERRKLVAPLWAEFNRRVASSNLGADARVRLPAMPMPDSVIARFLEVPKEQRR
jgi:putative glycosyltransferase (TIGR04372 family)